MNKEIIGRLILDRVLKIKHTTGLNNDLPKQLQKNSFFFKEESENILLGENQNNKSNQYNRTVIAKESDIYEGFEVVLIDWNHMNKHCDIHGHPQLMYYQVLSGTYVMNLYRVEEENKVSFERSFVLKEGDIYTSLSDDKGYSNAVHSMQCIRPGKTLNIYSGDGMKGKRFCMKKPYPLKLEKYK